MADEAEHSRCGYPGCGRRLNTRKETGRCYKHRERTPEQKEQRAEYTRQWRADNPDRVRENRRNYHEANKDTRHAAVRQWREDNPELRMLGDARRRARRFQIPFDLTVQDIVIPEYCPVLGIKLEYAAAPGYSPASPSLDRIVPELGYVRGNVQVISNKANTMKHNATREELLAFARWIAETFGDDDDE